MNDLLPIAHIIEAVLQSANNEERDSASLRLRRLLDTKSDLLDQTLTALEAGSIIRQGEEGEKSGYSRRGNAYWFMGQIATFQECPAIKLAELIEKGISDPHWWVRDIAVESFGYVADAYPSIATPGIVLKIANLIEKDSSLNAMSSEGFDNTLQSLLDKIPENEGLIDRVNEAIAGSAWQGEIGPYGDRKSLITSHGRASDWAPANPKL
jgi:hypothetical protein